MFESDLFELSKLIGRPADEFQGAQVDVHGNGNLSWRIESSVRGNLKSPGSKTLIFTTMDVHWDDGLCRAMQRLLARLCEEHKAELVNSHFRFYGGAPMMDTLSDPRYTRRSESTSWTWRLCSSVTRRI